MPITPDRRILTVHEVRLAAGVKPQSPLVTHVELSSDHAVWNGFIFIGKDSEKSRQMLGVHVTACGGDLTFEQNRRIEAIVAFYKRGSVSPRIVTYGIAETSDHLSFTVRRFQGIRIDQEFDEKVWLRLELNNVCRSADTPVTTDQIDLKRSPHMDIDLLHDIGFIAKLTKGFLQSAGVKP